MRSYKQERKRSIKKAERKEHEILVGYLGKHSVRYRCVSCQELLRSALKNAGKVECCPKCDQHFVVPGYDDFLKLKNELDLPRLERIRVLKLKTQASIESLEHQLLNEFNQAELAEKSRLREFGKALEFELESKIRNTEYEKKRWKEELLLKLTSKCAKTIQQICDMKITERKKQLLIERIFVIRRTASALIIQGLGQS